LQFSAPVAPGRGSFSQMASPSTNSLQVVLVSVHVRPEHVDAFRAATTANAEASRAEPGVARFDVIEEADDPTRFVLFEVYRTPQAVAAHKETAHYQRWRDAVAEMMAEPRASKKYRNVSPDDAGW
jgi:autoinducer 2-degrading protein